MAKVLKEAIENPELWKTEATCTGKGWEQEELHPCYCLIEVTALDIRKRAFDGDAYYGFICPKCGCFTELSKDNVPRDIREKARPYSEKEVHAILQNQNLN